MVAKDETIVAITARDTNKIPVFLKPRRECFEIPQIIKQPFFLYIDLCDTSVKKRYVSALW